MDDSTIRDIYAFFIFLVGMVLIYSSIYYYGPIIFNIPLYINIAIILIAIPAAIDLLDRTIKEAKIRKEKFNKNNGQ
jgi:hypothetical protein